MLPDSSSLAIHDLHRLTPETQPLSDEDQAEQDVLATEYDALASEDVVPVRKAPELLDDVVVMARPFELFGRPQRLEQDERSPLRIEVLGIDIIPDDGEPGLLRIEIDYRLRAASSRFSFVYPFYLEQGGGRDG